VNPNVLNIVFNAFVKSYPDIRSSDRGMQCGASVSARRYTIAERVDDIVITSAAERVDNVVTITFAVS
jgi:hypothetical protein